MIELNVDDARALYEFLCSSNAPIAARLSKALECLNLTSTSDAGMIIMVAPEHCNYNLQEFEHG